MRKHWKIRRVPDHKTGRSNPDLRGANWLQVWSLPGAVYHCRVVILYRNLSEIKVLHLRWDKSVTILVLTVCSGQQITWQICQKEFEWKCSGLRHRNTARIAGKYHWLFKNGRAVRDRKSCAVFPQIRKAAWFRRNLLADPHKWKTSWDHPEQSGPLMPLYLYIRGNRTQILPVYWGQGKSSNALLIKTAIRYLLSRKDFIQMKVNVMEECPVLSWRTFRCYVSFCSPGLEMQRS